MDDRSPGQAHFDAVQDDADDALTLLRDDHQQVSDLFANYEAAGHSADDQVRQAMAERLCALLTVHAQIEEELFYPALRNAIDRQDLLDEAEVEHAIASDLVEQIQSMDPEDELYDAKVSVLGEYVKHHVEEEEYELFPLVELSGIDLQALGAQLQERQAELLREYGVEGLG